MPKAIQTVEWKGHPIHDPAALDVKERNDFMKGLDAEPAPSVVVEEKPLEEIVLSLWQNQLQGEYHPKVEVSERVARMARDYSRYAKAGARLPKFSRWVTSMFASDQEIGSLLAKVGQVNAVAGEVVLSTKTIDILRSAATNHFYTCFGPPDSTYGDMPKKIVEEAPGIAMAYVDAPDGTMKGRLWLHHARHKDGREGIVIEDYAKGSIDRNAVIKALKARGFTVFKASDSYYNRGNANGMYVDCFTENVHHDHYTWVNPTLEEIK